MKHKLGIVVPYRDRIDQLEVFRKTMSLYLEDIDYELIIVDQQCSNDFNRGKLLNIGFIKAEELGCDYVVFHDIDMLPIDVDYSYSEEVLHLVDKMKTDPGFSRDNFDEYFGGVTLFPVDLFKAVNGYTNEYYGWGFEDDNLMLRCREVGIKLGRKKIIQRARDGVSLKFNGKDSFAALPNILNTTRDFTISTTFKIDELPSIETNMTDTCSIFSIPGFDTTLTYDSFKTFSFQFWKKDLSSMSIPSKRLPEGTYNVSITIENKADPKKVTFYINGELVGELAYDKLYPINKAKYIYLGVGDPDRKEKGNWLNGSIANFAIFNSALTETQIKRISNNVDYSFFDLDLPDLAAYYDGKFVNGNTIIDLSGRNNEGHAFRCTREITEKNLETYIDIPNRRKGTLKAVTHTENGYTDGYWKTWQSRINQLDYFKKYYSKSSGYEADGLSTLVYTKEDEIIEGNFHHLKVQLT